MEKEVILDKLKFHIEVKYRKIRHDDDFLRKYIELLKEIEDFIEEIKQEERERKIKKECEVILNI